MKIGDRVIITASSHPWHDDIGRIVEAAPSNLLRIGLDWCVKLETTSPGQQVYAGANELRVLA